MRRPRLRRADESAWRSVAALVGVATLVIAIAALLARLYNGDRQVLIVIAALAHQLLWAAPVAVALFLVSRRRYALVVAAAVLVPAVATQLPTYVGSTSPRRAGRSPSYRPTCGSGRRSPRTWSRWSALIAWTCSRLSS